LARWLAVFVAVVRWWWWAMVVRMVAMRVVFVHMLYHCRMAAADGQRGGCGQDKN
jgi:hypothetical protein